MAWPRRTPRAAEPGASTSPARRRDSDAGGWQREREQSVPVRATLGDARDWDDWQADDEAFESSAAGEDGDFDVADAGEAFETPARPASSHRSARQPASAAAGASDIEADEAPAPAAARRGPSLKARAVGLLSRREYSRHALAARLAQHEPDAEVVSALLDDLQRAGWLSDERYARSVLNQRSARQGERRIIGELRRQRVDDTLLQSLSEDLRATEYERAWSVWCKRFEDKAPPNEPREYARQARFLAARGFGGDVVSKVLRAALQRRRDEDEGIDG